jgi:hypothetical protein
MIKVSVELHPYGDESKKSRIADIYIANAGGCIRTGDLTHCTYQYWVGNDPRKKWSWPDGEIIAIREEGVYSLLQKVMDDYSSVKIIGDEEYQQILQRKAFGL